ncbi:hypothetical protein OZK63_03340 [Streptomyces sp. UMAF16]|nr:hypothetical protein [Streptomyces sp. UMAF16]
MLTELAASAGIPVEMLLRQVGAAARVLEQPLPTGPAVGEPSGDPGPETATVLRGRPGDEEWGVEPGSG